MQLNSKSMINEGAPKKIIRRERQTRIPGAILLKTSDPQEFVTYLQSMGFDGELELEYLQVYYYKPHGFSHAKLFTEDYQFKYWDEQYYVIRFEKWIIEEE